MAINKRILTGQDGNYMENNAMGGQLDLCTHCFNSVLHGRGMLSYRIFLKVGTCVLCNCD
jgi:hypothetical protein